MPYVSGTLALILVFFLATICLDFRPIWEREPDARPADVSDRLRDNPHWVARNRSIGASGGSHTKGSFRESLARARPKD